jgi:hypothetical protein
MRKALRVQWDSNELALISELSGDFVVYNMHKKNRKVVQEKVPTGTKVYSGKTVSFKRNLGIIEEGKWVLQAYLIPKTLVDYFGVVFDQQERHFNIFTV